METSRHSNMQRDIIDLSTDDSSSSADSADMKAHKSDFGSDEKTDAEVAQEVSAIDPEELARITDDIVQALKTVFDPEIPVDIYELGLIYKVDLSDDRLCRIHMTLTAPGCPVAEDMPVWVDNAVRGVLGIADVQVEMTFDPPWTPERMSDEAKLVLNMY